jgi:hypothetical protein
LVSLIPPSITGIGIGKYIDLRLCGGSNIIASPDPVVVAWMQLHGSSWTQGCGRGFFAITTDDLIYTVGKNTVLIITAPGVLENDTLGTPAGIVTFFGGGSLAGVVTDHAAGATINPLPTYSDGSLVANANGSFAFTPPTNFVGIYTFQYRLDNGVGASDATVTIQVAPGFSVDDESGFESNTATITFTVTLTDTTDLSTTVDYVTADGTATAGSDYLATGGTLTFDPGVTTQPIVVHLRGDAVVEGAETFVITLSNPTNAPISDAQGEGTITNSTVKPTRPAADSLIRDDTPTFVWAAIAGAAHYRLQVDNNADFSSLVINTLVTTRQYTPTALADATYYWRVRARDAAGNWGGWCTRWAVTIDATPPAKPVQLAPANGATLADNTPRYRWNAVSGATVYQLQLDNNSDFSSPILNKTLAGTAYTQPSALGDRTYYWRVRAQDEAGNWSAWSTRWSFIVNAVPMVQPTLIPTNTPRPTRSPQPTLIPTATVVPTTLPTTAPTATPTTITPFLQVVESDNSLVMQSGLWGVYGEPAASGGTYLLSSTPQDTLTLAFIGSEVTIVYIQHPSVGSLAIEIDGTVMQIVDGVVAEAVFGAETTVSGLVYGQHTLRVYPVSGVVAIDAFKVEMALQVVVPTATPVPADIPTDVPTDIPTDIPTDMPTETPLPTETPIPTEAPTVVPTETPTLTETLSETPVPDATEEPAS